MLNWSPPAQTLTTADAVWSAMRAINDANGPDCVAGPAVPLATVVNFGPNIVTTPYEWLQSLLLDVLTRYYGGRTDDARAALDACASTGGLPSEVIGPLVPPF